MSPAAAQATTVVTTPTRKCQKAMNAAAASGITSQSGSPPGNAAWRATNTASAAITPTTAIVIPLSELANDPVWRTRSMIGALVMMKTNEGMNVHTVAIVAPAT